jgi:hypothetical protein
MPRLDHLTAGDASGSPSIDVEYAIERLPLRWLECVAGVVGGRDEDALSDVGRHP